MNRSNSTVEAAAGRHPRARHYLDESRSEPPLEFNAFACPLQGVNQIEASAGTGKTWNLCALYVRLLLEKALNVEQILVVTFCKAATAELHERIRTSLVQLLSALTSGHARHQSGSDPFVEQVCSTIVGLVVPRHEARLRLERALHSFDQAAIYTIHGFCQRVLTQVPFTAALPFEMEQVVQDEALHFELAVEFWQTHIEPAAADPGFAAWLAQRGADPTVLAAQLAKRLRKPLARLVFASEPGDGSPQTDPATAHGDLPALFEQAHALWRHERDAIADLLHRSLTSLHSTFYHAASITLAFDAWARYFEDGNPHAALDDKAGLLTASTLSQRVKKKGTLPQHPFFILADAIVAQAAAVDARYTTRWLSLMQKWLTDAPERLRQRKRARRVASFDDLLINLQRALIDQPWLIRWLQQRYPAALIDEFQDTDPLQFDIFSRIFTPHGPLFLVGDPKQAIYSFRAADLYTYLAARAQASACYTLTTNHRSTASLIAACNRIFSANPAAFVLEGLCYRPVRAPTAPLTPTGPRPWPFTHGGPRTIEETIEEGANSDPLQSDFRVWLLPDGEQVLPKRDAMEAAARACASEIVRLLSAPSHLGDMGEPPQAGSAKGLPTPLMPHDIAVLVQTHKQGSLMKRVLAEAGISSVEMSQASVFSTPEAEHLERVLEALNTPNDSRRLRGALTVDWFGVDALTLAQFEQTPMSMNHESLLGRWAERFAYYQTLWHERGFAVLWRTLMHELRIAQRIAAYENGERRLTHLNHLAELIGTHATDHPGLAPTLRWFSAQRQLQQCDEESQWRLESDRDLVQIMTVHKSKGLEYAVVLCPFLNDGSKYIAASSTLPPACEYHDGNGCAVLHYGGDKAELAHAKEAVKQEQAAERARLIYVALTRATHRCYLVAGLYTSGPSTSTKEARQSVLNWLVAGAGYPFSEWLAHPPQATEITACWQALAHPAISVEPLPMTRLAKRPRPVEAPTHAPSACVARRALRETWQIRSFSSLIVNEPPERYPSWSATGTVHADTAADDILDFPCGLDAGNCLHRLFELTDLAAPSTWPAAVERALRERPLQASPSLARRLPAMMMRLLHDLASTPLTPLAPGLTLASIQPARRFVEWEFTFPASMKLTALRSLLTQYGYPEPALTPTLHTLTGYLKGLIDLVFEYDQRFWIVDWKSHHLGYTAADYQRQALSEAMALHGYHCQALIYTLALHRYLRLRLPDYDYATHVGGYFYLFVRGIRPQWQEEGSATGVYADKPNAALIEALDRLLGDSHVLPR